MLLMVIRLERKTVKRKRVFATLKVLGTVLEQLTKEVSPEEAGRLIPEEVWDIGLFFLLIILYLEFCLRVSTYSLIFGIILAFILNFYNLLVRTYFG